MTRSGNSWLLIFRRYPPRLPLHDEPSSNSHDLDAGFLKWFYTLGGRVGIGHQHVQISSRANTPACHNTELTMINHRDTAPRVFDHHRIQMGLVRTETARSPFYIKPVGSDQC